MKCKYKPTGEVINGREKHVCQRRNCITPAVWVPVGNKIVPAYCMGFPAWHDLGDWCALFLVAIGVTEQRYLWFKYHLKLLPECNCQQRIESLNRSGERLAEVGRCCLQVLCWITSGHSYQCSRDGCRCRHCGKQKDKASI